MRPRLSQKPFLTTMCTALFLCPPAQAGEDTTKSPLPIVVSASGFSLKLPKAETVVYRGMVNHDAAGLNGGQILYPGFGLAGFLVAIAAHGVIVESAKNSEKTKLQEAADKVLAPYSAALGEFSNKELLQRAMAKLSVGGSKKIVEAAGTPESGWVVESMPVFTLTQDQGALVLENAVAVYAADAPSTILYQNIVKVVSDARAEPQPETFWGAEQSKKLKEESVDLFAHSLDVVLREIAKEAGGDAEIHKTFRYPEGKTQKMERGQLLGERCNRAIIKNLRGWLMSIPLRRDATEPPANDQCVDSYRYPA